MFDIGVRFHGLHVGGEVHLLELCVSFVEGLVGEDVGLVALIDVSEDQDSLVFTSHVSQDFVGQIQKVIKVLRGDPIMFFSSRIPKFL